MNFYLPAYFNNLSFFFIDWLNIFDKRFEQPFIISRIVSYTTLKKTTNKKSLKNYSWEFFF